MVGIQIPTVYQNFQLMFQGESDASSSSSYIIDLPGVPVTGSIDDLREEESSSEENEEQIPPPKKAKTSIPSSTITPRPSKVSAAAKTSRGPVIDEPFHGFLPSEIPKRKIIIPDNFVCDASGDLSKIFTKELLLEGDDLTKEDLSSGSSKPTVAKRPTPPSIIVAMSTITSSKPIPEPVKSLSGQVSILVSPSSKPGSSRGPATPKSLPSPIVRESRDWKPSAQFFKPLSAGTERTPNRVFDNPILKFFI